MLMRVVFAAALAALAVSCVSTGTTCVPELGEKAYAECSASIGSGSSTASVR